MRSARALVQLRGRRQRARARARRGERGFRDDPRERPAGPSTLGGLRKAGTFTRFTPDAAWAPRMNSTYRWNGPDRWSETDWEKYWDSTMERVYPVFRACGGLYSTVFDSARFLKVWTDLGRYEGGRLLSEQTVRAAFADPVPAGETSSYGFQWRIRSPPSVPGGLPTFGHGGINGTRAVAIPHRDALLLY